MQNSITSSVIKLLCNSPGVWRVISPGNEKQPADIHPTHTVTLLVERKVSPKREELKKVARDGGPEQRIFTES